MAILTLLVAFGFMRPAYAWADECPAGGPHDFEATLIAPNTDDADGLQRFICLKCGYSYDETIPATGHAWGAWETVVAPTCDANGVEQRVCAHDASHVEERIVPALASDGQHAWAETDRSPATCELPGWVRSRCSRCGAEKTEALPASGHDWGAWETLEEPTADRAGRERRVCRNDASHVEERGLAQLAAPTQTESTAAAEASTAHSEPADLAAAPEEQEQPSPWAPNALDAALLGVDLVGAVAFAVLMVPLVHARRWVLKHRAIARANALRRSRL